MSDEIPSDPTLAATVARTSWGQYGATLTLPDGEEHVFSGADLDGVRARVLEDARAYLASQVGHPGRLQVTDPDGTWLLGVPHDGGELVAISSAPAPSPPISGHGVPTGVPTTTARPMLLPSRPAIPARGRGRRRRASSGAHWNTSSRRLAILALIAAVILGLVLVQALDRNGSSATAAKHTQSPAEKPAARTSSPPAATPDSEPTPRRVPARSKPTTSATAHHKAPVATARRSARPVPHHHAAATSSSRVPSTIPAATPASSAPVVAQTTPAQTHAASEPTHTATTAPLPSPSGPPPL